MYYGFFVQPFKPREAPFKAVEYKFFAYDFFLFEMLRGETLLAYSTASEWLPS